jgi:lycopene cyclase domain-containing protein
MVGAASCNPTVDDNPSQKYQLTFGAIAPKKLEEQLDYMPQANYWTTWLAFLAALYFLPWAVVWPAVGDASTAHQGNALCFGCAKGLCQHHHTQQCVPGLLGSCNTTAGFHLCDHDCSTPTYFELDVDTLLLPIVCLILLPPLPFGFGFQKKAFLAVGMAVPLFTSLMALAFSTLWDNIIASHHVWTYDAKCMKGVLFAIPYEEYAWFVLHTLLAQALLLRMWAAKPGIASRPDFPSRCHDMKVVVPVVVLLASTMMGIKLCRDGNNDHLYLGIIMAFMSPVLAFIWAGFAHFFLWAPASYVAAIVLESAYVITVDQFAISRGIWHIYPGTGVRLPLNMFGNTGIQIEQFLIYSLTTVLVVSTLQPFLVITECYYKYRVQGGWFKFALRMLLTDGKYQPPLLDTRHTGGVLHTH